MENTISSRLSAIVKSSGLSERAFALSIGINQSTLNNQIIGRTDVNLKTVVAIISHFPDISARWFLLGEGSMKLPPAPTAVITDSAGSVINQGTAKTISTDPSLRDLYESIKKKDQQIEKLIDLLTNKYPSTLS